MPLVITSINQIVRLSTDYAVKQARPVAQQEERRIQSIARASFIATGRKNPGNDIRDITIMVNDNGDVYYIAPQFHFGIRNFENEIFKSAERIRKAYYEALAKRFFQLYAFYFVKQLRDAVRGNPFWRLKSFVNGITPNSF